MSEITMSEEAASALHEGRPIVALESAVITHGLPHPHNLETALAMEGEVRAGAAIPATVAFIDGQARVGLSGDEISTLATADHRTKISIRDIGLTIAGLGGQYGGTTVAATMQVASRAGLAVFATGGIGGVHRGASASFDISADLPMLARTPMIVVCSGAKAILDLPATHEWLETWGVPLLGWQTDDFPAFYSISSGLGVDLRVNTAAEVVAVAWEHWGAGLSSALIVAVPPPAEVAIDTAELEDVINQALAQAERSGIHGRETTPFLLDAVRIATAGRSMSANIALLRNNAAVATAIAREYYGRGH
jgi:pseudouridine-5'-phosphate glycosidase